MMAQCSDHFSLHYDALRWPESRHVKHSSTFTTRLNQPSVMALSCHERHRMMQGIPLEFRPPRSTPYDILISQSTGSSLASTHAGRARIPSLVCSISNFDKVGA